MNIVKELLVISEKNQYLTFTQHSGEDFHLIEKYLDSWKSGEIPLS